MEPSARPTVRGRRTEAALQDAARRVIARKGFLNTTISDIAVEAGRSAASFYNYWDSKEDLLGHWAATFKSEARERSLQSYRHGFTHVQMIEDSVRSHWETYKAHLAEMIGVYQFSMVNEEFSRRWREMCAEAINSIAIGVVRAQRDGYCPGANPKLVASAIVAMINDFCYVWLGQGGEAIEADFDDEQAIETLAMVWRRAIYWRDDETTDAT